jgi:hypothetical protein
MRCERGWLENGMIGSRALALAVAGVAMLSAAVAQTENYEAWALLKTPFESTGGGGIMIGGYDPITVGDKCRTDFTATEPGGKVYDNTIEFDAVQAQGGVLCTNGKWQAKDGSASGTTPFRVFIKGGVVRRSP